MGVVAAEKCPSDLVFVGDAGVGVGDGDEYVGFMSVVDDKYVSPGELK